MSYLDIPKHYEKCFEKHGDCPKGVDWPNEKDAHNRFKVMLNCLPIHLGIGIETEKISILDFGCGSAQLLDFLKSRNVTLVNNNLKYVGVDISDKFIDFCKLKYPTETFIKTDVLVDASSIPACDLVIANGVFTMKMSLSQAEMETFFQECLLALWKKTGQALAFNVMSKQVDWERDDLFHLSLDSLAKFLCEKVTRNFVIRNDYGLYEYTTYVYR